VKPVSLFLLFTMALAAQDYSRDVQPVFAQRCYSCHGSKLHMGELRLDRKADALRGRGSGVRAIVPGKSARKQAFFNAGKNVPAAAGD
jgi:hypothetical protein